MNKMNAITLDQFSVFMTVVKEGSFAAAARKLHRVQSSITYTVQKLEEQSGVVLFDRSSYRVSLTEAGYALLPRISRILEDFSEFQVQTETMKQGVEAELTMVVDNFLSLSLMTSALEKFKLAYPKVQLRINAAWAQDAVQQLIHGEADLGAFFGNKNLPPELEYEVITDIDLVAVAAPTHPLSSLPPDIPREQMRDHLQIIVSNPKSSRDSPAFGIVGVNQWRVNESRLRYNLIMAGIGWGSMPRPMVAAEIERGELIELKPARWDSSNRMPRVVAVVAKCRGKAIGPAATFLRNEIAAAAETKQDS